MTAHQQKKMKVRLLNEFQLKVTKCDYQFPVFQVEKGKEVEMVEIRTIM